MNQFSKWYLRISLTVSILDKGKKITEKGEKKKRKFLKFIFGSDKTEIHFILTIEALVL